MKAFLLTLINFPLLCLDFIAGLYTAFLNKCRPNLGDYWFEAICKKNGKLKRYVLHRNILGKDIGLWIHTPNWICRFRADSFSTKEPETLEWIDEYGGRGAFFDIGANIGLYSLYYAKTKKGRVYSFEPSVFNLAQLVKNIHVNHLNEMIEIITNPLTDTNQFAKFTLTGEDEGGALSSFGVEYGHDGKKLNETLSYRTLGFSLDYLVKNRILPEIPSMIKMDVDGIEHLILSGAVETLKNPICKTILIEIDKSFTLQANEISKILTECGFEISHKRQSEMMRVGNFANISNYIWIKNNALE